MERTIKNGQSRDTANIEQRQTKSKKTQKIIKEKQHEIQVFPKSKQFRLHISHRQCYS